MRQAAITHRIGLVGAGIGTSLSPALHEHEAAALGLTDYGYDLLDLEVEKLAVERAGESVLDAVERGYTGFNITHPCKQVVMGVLDELSDNARQLGAVNTVVLDRGRLVGHNTDHSGFLDAFRRSLPHAALGRVVLAGAGGAGSAVAFALVTAGVDHLEIGDVDFDRATDLCTRLRTTWPGVDATAVPIEAVEAAVRRCDGVVNASPAGMVGHAETPFDPAVLRPGLWVADIVYRPLRTTLLKGAEAAGCAVLDGGQMLVAQAADSFSLLTGVAPDRARMRRHLNTLVADQAPVADIHQDVIRHNNPLFLTK